MPRLALILTLCATLLACRAEQTTPSAEFERALRLWSAALNEKADAAASDPRAREALALARQVPADSADSEAAALLITGIETALKEEAAARELRQAPLALAAPESEPEPAPQPEPVQKAEAPVVGSEESEFLKSYGACVAVESEFLETGGTRKGQAWGLVDEACRAKHPELGARLVFILEGKVFNVAPRSQAKTLVSVDGGDFVPEEAAAAPVEAR